MRWPGFLVVAVGGLAAAQSISTGNESTFHPSPVTLTQTPSRQTVDAKPAHEHTQHVHNHATHHHAPPELDVAYQPLTFSAGDVERMLALGTGRMTLPSGQQIELAVEQQWRAHGMQFARLRHAGLVSVLSQRGPNFYLTLATPTETYRIEGQQNHTALYSQRQIDHRSITHAQDYIVP